MVEKIRLTLWDIFIFFLTGFLIAVILISSLLLLGIYEFNAFVNLIKELPSSILLVLAPLLFTLIGMLIEPIANYFDKYILKYLLWWVDKQTDLNSEEEKILENEIKNKYLGSLNGKIDRPFSICKEYVETKQLSTTFMIFLSRYGFYRNLSFITFTTGLALAIHISDKINSSIVMIVAYFLAAVFKKRSADFYSYMAPAIYRAFLIDKLNWSENKNV